MSTTPDPDDHLGVRRHGPRFVTGRLLAGRYEILEPIGEGGTAEVFRARDHRLDRTVAIKVLRPQYGQDPDARSRFAIEARSAAALSASNVVPVYDFGAADDGSLFIVMRFIDGPSLRRVLSARGALPAGEVADIGWQVALALAAAHDRGLVHRDVKPGNILLDADGAVHLTDFGTVKALGGTDDLTRTGMIFGTAAYLSPEQATGGEVGPAADLYALGVVLYEALSGRPPFTGDDPLSVTYRHAHELPTPLHVAAPGVDRDIEQVVMQSLEKDPLRRPRNAHDVAAALGSIADRIRATGTEPPLGALAAGASAASMPADAPWEPEKHTVLMPTVPAEPETAVWSGPAPRRAMPDRRMAASASAGAGVASPAEIEMGIARPPRGTRARRRRDTRPATLLALLLALLIVAGAVVALPRLMSDGDGAGIVDATASPRFTPAAAIAETPATAATDTPSPEPLPTVVAPPAATDVPTDVPTDPPPPTPAPTPEPTSEPTPAPTAQPRPPAEVLTARIPNRQFEGAYDGPGSDRYHGRSASWVYGQGTAYHTMTARFRLEPEGEIGRRASLTLVGIDGENERRNRIAVVLNDVTIYEGPNPLPNDDGPSGGGNWGSAVIEFSGDILQRNNELSITNLEDGDCTRCPNFVMIDDVFLEYRVRP